MLTVWTPLTVRGLNCSNHHALAVICLIVAAAAFVVALVALYIAIEESGLFMDRRNARARFQLTVRVIQGAANNVLEIQPGVSSVMVRLGIGLENKGEQAAGARAMEVRVPGSIPRFRWTDGGGVPYGSGPAATSQSLPLGGGGETPALWVSTEIRRVRLRTPALRWFCSGLNPA